MYNYFMLIGKVKKVEEVNEKVGKITIEVQRDFRNPDGTKTSDEFEVLVRNGMLSITQESLIEGQVIGIKGRIIKIDNGIALATEHVKFFPNNSEN